MHGISWESHVYGQIKLEQTLCKCRTCKKLGTAKSWLRKTYILESSEEFFVAFSGVFSFGTACISVDIGGHSLTIFVQLFRRIFPFPFCGYMRQISFRQYRCVVKPSGNTAYVMIFFRIRQLLFLKYFSSFEAWVCS